MLELSLAELRESLHVPVSDEELRIAKDQAISSILLGLESSSARAGRCALQGGRSFTDVASRLMKFIEKIARSRLMNFRKSRALTSIRKQLHSPGVLGNLNGLHVDRSRLAI